jgi:hypothetical protein
MPLIAQGIHVDQHPQLLATNANSVATYHKD